MDTFAVDIDQFNQDAAMTGQPGVEDSFNNDVAANIQPLEKH